MIKVTFDAETMELTMEGHAGAAERGKDIVCSAVSTLFYTLAYALAENGAAFDQPPEVEIRDGYGRIRCVPKDEYVGTIQLIYWTILIGLEKVAENNSKFVSFTSVRG